MNKRFYSNDKSNTYTLCSVLILLLTVTLLGGCGQKADPYAEKPVPTVSVTEPADPTDSSVNNASDRFDPVSPIPTPLEYSFYNDDRMTLEGRINPPAGYYRPASQIKELVAFLRNLPLKKAGSEVLLYNGQPKRNQNIHVAVFDLSLSNRDLQQCADSAIRIFAEYYWSIGAYDKIAFHLTNGFYMEYTKWRDGNRIKVDGNEVRWYKAKAYDASYEEFLNYLDMVFAYAGTLSLSSECDRITLEELMPGDLFLQGGSPGHCVVVVDMAVDAEGSKCYLLAQGYMPAQDFHILKNPLHPEDPWYYTSEITFPFDTPSWQFEEDSLCRFDVFPYQSLEEIAAVPAWFETALKDQQSSSQVSLLAVGDNLIHREVIASGVHEDGTCSYDHLYANLKDEISAADIAVVNQETIFGGKAFGYSGYPSFNSPTEIGDALIDAGFDVVLSATNHTLDKGVEGLYNTFAYWKTKPSIHVLGINETEEAAKKICIIEKNGIKIAMLNYTFSLNGNKLPKDQPYLVNMLDKEKMAQDIALAEKEADFTIVFPHWGTEYVYKPIPMQKDLKDFFYEAGVDLVIGTHPHVLEPVEWVGEEGEHQMLVYYSLGNFLSYQREAPRMLGAMAEVTITKDTGGTYISHAGITPIITHYENGPADYHYAIYKLTDYTPTLAKLHGVSEIAENGPLVYHEIFDLAKQVLGSWFTAEEVAHE